MKINTLGDWARYFLLFWGIPVGFKSDRLNHSHEGSEHTRSGTKLAYSWSQRCRTKSQQFETHIGTFFPPLEIKNRNIYVLWAEMRFYGRNRCLEGDLNISAALSHQHRTNETINNQRARPCKCHTAFKDRAGSIMDILIITSQSYRIIMWSNVLKWQILW